MIGGLLSDRRGVAAVEFALIVPLLLSMYFVTMEVAQAIEANKKVSRVGSMVADLVTQQQAISNSELTAIMRIGKAILQPYNRSELSITITAFEVTNEATPTVNVVWSGELPGSECPGPPPVESPLTVPDALRVRGSFLIRVESSLAYRPVITWAASESTKAAIGLAAAFGCLPMKETYYLRPRMSTTIPCPDCS
jgi:Flp pilus assembly protein TadG